MVRRVWANLHMLCCRTVTAVDGSADCRGEITSVPHHNRLRILGANSRSFSLCWLLHCCCFFGPASFVMGMNGEGTATHQGEDNPEVLRRQQAHLDFVASHQARHAARQQNSSSAGEERVNRVPKEESILLFNENFSGETKDITTSLAKLVAASKEHTAAGGGLSGARHAGAASAATDTKEGIREELDALVDRVKGLRKLTAEATFFLPVYDLRRAQEEVGKLLASVESTRAELAPRKKFAFRSRRRTAAPGKAPEDPPEQNPAADGGAGDGHGENGLELRDMAGREVEVKAEEVDKDKDFNLTDLDTCTVSILHVLGALRLRRLTSCRVVCGPVRGPIYVEGCKDCVVVAAGRQLRIHESYGVDFYVLVASGPIIEDCCRLRFAPTGLRYPQYELHLQEAGLAEASNAWEDVKDFKWHRAQRSPNWEVIPEGQREVEHLRMTAQKK